METILFKVTVTPNNRCSWAGQISTTEAGRKSTSRGEKVETLQGKKKKKIFFGRTQEKDRRVSEDAIGERAGVEMTVSK